MKKLSLLILAFLSIPATWGQILDIRSIDKVNSPVSEMTTEVAAISPDGDFLLLTSQAQKGLVKLDLNSNASTIITTARGAGFNVKISDDGNIIAYQEVEINNDRLLMRSVKTKDLSTGKITTITEPSRELQGFEFDKNVVNTIVDNNIKTTSLKGSSTHSTKPVVSNKNLKLFITSNGQTREFTPNGNQFSYIWASISPNAKRILYYVSELGCYTCNLDGSGMIKLGELSAPQWIDDNTVIGMYDLDNGVTITSSSIIVKTLDGKEQKLTADNMISLYPHPATNTGKIAFSTIEGDIYIINYTK